MGGKSKDKHDVVFSHFKCESCEYFMFSVFVLIFVLTVFLSLLLDNCILCVSSVFLCRRNALFVRLCTCSSGEKKERKKKY